MRTVKLGIEYFNGPCGQRLRQVLGAFLTVLQVASFCVAQEPGDYIVGPNDVLAITVVDQPQLTGKYIVQADGTFTFPLLGRLKAGGLSLQAVENDVRDRLARRVLEGPAGRRLRGPVSKPADFRHG